MPVYLYCILASDVAVTPELVLGVDGATVRALDAGPLRAWVSDVGDRPLAPTPERVRAHDRVIRAAMAVETPLPARFGQVVAADEAVRDVIRERQPRLTAALRTVRGAVEMTVRVLLDAPLQAREERISAPATGREYLDRIREAERVAEAAREGADFLHARIANTVATVVRAEVRAPSRSPPQSLTVAHLVARERVSEYRSALHALREEDPAMTLLISGPWPPYSFAESAH